MRYGGKLVVAEATGGGIRFVRAYDRVVRPLPDIAAHIPDNAAVREGKRPPMREISIAREVICHTIVWGRGLCDGIVGIAAPMTESSSSGTTVSVTHAAVQKR